MITSEKLLKIISIIVLFSTVSFAVVTVIIELMKPEEKFERIVHDHCPEGYSGLEREESTQELSEQNCIFISSDKLKALALSKYSDLGNVEGFDHLFIGSKGILLKKNITDYKAPAVSILDCIRKNECPTGNTDAKYTVTILMKNVSGRLEASVSYVDTELSQISKNGRKLLLDIVKIKNVDINTLKTLIYFHHTYTFIEDKTPAQVVFLMKKGLDGLYLESRGAKIRVLPDEYRSNDPFELLDKKGVQYGLEKNEYKKDDASIYIYRTTQYIEHNGDMVPFFINSKEGKDGYSDRISALFISKHLKNIQETSGKFSSGIEISDGTITDEKDSLISQGYASLSLLRAAVLLGDTSLLESAKRSLEYIISTEPDSYEMKAFMISLISNCKENCRGDSFADTFAKYSEEFQNIEKIKEMADNQPIYIGFFINAALLVNTDKGLETKLVEIMTGSIQKYEKMKPEEKIRFISSIAEINAGQNTDLEKTVRNFISKEASFLRSISFKNRGFSDTVGGIAIKESSLKPDTALTVLLASGLSTAVKNDLTDKAISKIESENGNFIKHLIVTDDDFPAWSSTTAKVKVQGGVRAFPGSSKIRLFNSARALNYFTNRLSSNRDK